MNCQLCMGPTNLFQEATVLNKHLIKYYLCPNCGFQQTEKPFWLDEAYSESVSDTDTGLVARNIYFRDLFTIIIGLLKINKKGDFLDYGGGYGIFTRMMRDQGYNFFWDDKYTPNLMAKGFQARPQQNFSLITAIEVFEHFAEPRQEIERLLSLSNYLLFTTETLPDPVPRAGQWWYYCLEHGQHISFYSQKSLEIFAQKNNWNYAGKGSVHILSRRPIPFFVLPVAFIIMRLKLAWLFKFKSKTMSDMDLLKIDKR